VDFVAVVDQVVALLRQRGRVTYRTLQRQFQLNDETLTDLKDALLYTYPQIRDDVGHGLVWAGHAAPMPASPPPAVPQQTPRAYTPAYLAEKILTSRSALEGERKQVTVLFADIASFVALARGLDPEVVHEVMDHCFALLTTEVHRFEGTINQYTGDGIMALFGAPIAHEDSPRRAVHAALGMQRGRGQDWRRPAHGLYRGG
jgi:hypothetical protein